MIKIDSNRHYVHRPANKMVSIFRYSGAPDLARFEEAIGLGMSKHELLCTELYREGNEAAYYKKREDSQPVVKINIETYESVDPEEDDVETMLDIAIDWALEENPKVYNIDEGEWMHHGIFSDGNETVWAISSHYLAGDAQSIQFLVRDCIEIYEDLIAAPKDEAIQVEKITPYRPESFDFAAGFKKMSFFQKRHVNSLNSKWKKSTKIFDKVDFEDMNSNFHNVYKLKSLAKRLDRETTSKLLAKVKENDLSLSTIIPASFVVSSQERETMAHTLSTREGDYEGVGVYGGSVTLPQISILSSATDLLETAKSINKELEPALKDEQRIQRSNIIVANLDGNLLDSAYYSAFADWKNVASDLMQKTFSLKSSGEGMQINNIGELPQVKNNSFGELKEAYYIPSILPNFRRALAFNFVDGEMFITNTFYQDEKVELLIFNRAVEALEEFANS
ncbi:condensation domain-containing protein [Fastidiosipila sanguinis]|uniref:Condensation domain-containing protein n=1 Tax=Fastidiosipila sanguinis TaxID=236753 RepID=A0A2S0KLB0_9FIRM|nr:condensation domain-containing protein [Fastidiosipila sanguinis]AVM41826.1 hypothetical protein C5Q98_00640 [Fastidiosipila sanguinis]